MVYISFLGKVKIFSIIIPLNGDQIWETKLFTIPKLRELHCHKLRLQLPL